MDAEKRRLKENRDRTAYWARWGPYVSERQWGTVREDYSTDGSAWDCFPHEQSLYRAYRWGEDGIASICDNHQRLCFALAFWNEADPILKEKMFGLTSHQGNHGEDVKEYYFYLDNTPTHSYMKYLYKYPQTVYPYRQLVEENERRDYEDPEFERLDAGVFEGEIATLISLLNTLKVTMKTSLLKSQHIIAATKKNRCISCQRFGFVIPGLGMMRCLSLS